MSMALSLSASHLELSSRICTLTSASSSACKTPSFSSRAPSVNTAPTALCKTTSWNLHVKFKKFQFLPGDWPVAAGRLRGNGISPWPVQGCLRFHFELEVCLRVSLPQPIATWGPPPGLSGSRRAPQRHWWSDSKVLTLLLPLTATIINKKIVIYIL